MLLQHTTRLPEPTVAVPKPVAKADNVNKSPNKLVYILLFAVIALICTISILWAYQNHENGYSEKDNEIYDADVENIIYNNCFNTDFGIYIKNLTTGYEYGYNEGDAFPASAMSQIVVLSSLSEVIENNNINLNTENVYFEYMPNGKESPESKYEDGKYIKLKKCIEDVAVYGDNNKSNLLVDYIGNVNNESNGFDVIKRITRDNDYYITRISRKIFVNPMYIDNSELPNITTPKEIAMMFESLINTSEFGDSAYMKKIFNPVSDEGEPIGINKFVPQVYDVCGANGLNTQSTNNVAIIEFDDQQVLVAILSNTKDGSTDNEDSEDREIVIGNLVDHILKTQF